MSTDARREGGVELEAGRELDAMVGRELFGLCWHDFADDDEACLVDDRASFEEDFGTAPPVGWTSPYWYDENARLRCVRCGRRWRISSNGLGPREDQDVPRFSTAIAPAWSVVEKMYAAGWTFDFILDMDLHTARFTKHIEAMPTFRRDADTAPLAICRAAIATLTTPTQQILSTRTKGDAE